MPTKYIIDDRNIIKPSKAPDKVQVERGPNIAPVPLRSKMEDNLSAKLLLHLEDNITTDHIMPAGAKILPFRSNIPKISEFVFHYVDQDFPRKAKEAGSSAVVGGENYGQGSSREHAALAPMFLGVKFVIAKSFARIHKTNLVNFGILPLNFKNADDYDKLEAGDDLVINNITSRLKKGEDLEVENKTRGNSFYATYDLSARQVKILLAGGLLNYTKKNQG